MEIESECKSHLIENLLSLSIHEIMQFIQKHKVLLSSAAAAGIMSNFCWVDRAKGYLSLRLKSSGKFTVAPRWAIRNPAPDGSEEVMDHTHK